MKYKLDCVEATFDPKEEDYIYVIPDKYKIHQLIDADFAAHRIWVLLVDTENI
jgi:hypothetical protein